MKDSRLSQAYQKTLYNKDEEMVRLGKILTDLPIYQFFLQMQQWQKNSCYVLEKIYWNLHDKSSEESKELASYKKIHRMLTQEVMKALLEYLHSRPEYVKYAEHMAPFIKDLEDAGEEEPDYVCSRSSY